MARTRLILGPPEAIVERRPDGAILARSPHPLGPYVRTAADWLDRWAAVTPERVFLAERQREKHWRTITYGAARQMARSIAQGLIGRGLNVERPVAILSGNSVDHALIGLGAMIAGVPYAPVSAPYSLLSGDFARLKAIIALLTPGLAFVDDGAPFTAAIEAAVPPDVEIVAGKNPPISRPSTAFGALVLTKPTEDVDRAQAKVGPDTIAKLLFTSGSTGTPKGVINTHKMMTSNQAMLAAVTPSYTAEPPVLIDWLPWSHTFGGNNNFNLVLANGGSYYIDDGRPLPGAIEPTVRNLREISPTVYYNVPRGFEMLLSHLQADGEIRRRLFERLQAFTYAGAALAPHVREGFERLGLDTVGEVVPMLTSYGSTETGPSAISVTERARDPGVIGVPNPGVEVKLVPNGAKLEARLRSPSVTPGYWRQPKLTEAAFDEEGFYRIGDALRFVDESDPERGFLFDGRVAEDFKLATGAWVSVGPLRAKFVAHCAPYVTDVVVAGHDRDAVAALVIPNLAACRELAGAPNGEAAEILACAGVRETFAGLLETFNAEAGGSSRRLTRLILMDDPPSLDSGELTDKGSVNQRAVLNRRAAMVEELYAETPSRGAILWRA
jgi:feruloyl-CoA synthase